MGHGAAGAQSSEHYEKLGQTMLLAMEEVLQRLDVLAGRKLHYFSEVNKAASGEWNVERLSLATDTAWRLKPLGYAANKISRGACA